MRLLNRAVASASRRLGRPELLAAVNADVRRRQAGAVGVRAVLASSLRSDGVYVDVGANRGQFLREAVRIAPRGRHLAFEPIPGLAAELARAFPDVDCRPLALGARREVAQFCHFTRLDGWSGLLRDPEISDQRGAPEFISVQVSTLDAELNGLRPNVIKVDVEGAELAVLEGGRSALADARPVVIFEHVLSESALYGAAPEEPWDLFNELGYEVFSATGDGPFTRAQFARATILNWIARPSA